MNIKGNFTVNGIEFAYWFNRDFLPKYDYHFRNTFAKSLPASRLRDFNAVRTVLSLLPQISGKAETPLNELIAYFCLIYNETGATFKPISEYGQDWYFFEKGTGATIRQVYGTGLAWKASYNGILGNEFAGNQLLRKGIITTQSVGLWNSQDAYPHSQPDNVKMAARDCDFYRFRGRGLIQTTGKSTYEITIGSLLNGKNIDDLTNQELDLMFKDPTVYTKAVHNFYNLIPGKKNAVARAIAGDFDDIALATAGFNPQYIAEFVKRAESLKLELEKATISDFEQLDHRLFGLKPFQVIALQNALMNISEEFKTRIMNHGGADGILGKTTIGVFMESGKKLEELITV